MEIPFAPKKNRNISGDISGLPAPSRPDPNLKHAEALTAITDMAEENKHLRAVADKLQRDLEVAVALGHEFKRLHDLKEIELNKALTYSAEARTYFQSIYDLARRAHEQSKTVADAPKREPLTSEQGEKVVAEIEAELIGKKFGAGLANYKSTDEQKAELFKQQQNYKSEKNWENANKAEDK